MKRRLFNLAAAVSLVLCVATVALWVRGRLTWKYDQVAFNCAIRDDGGQTSLRAIKSPFGIDLGRVRTYTHALASPGWNFRSSRSTVTDTDVVAETYESLDGHGFAGAWCAAFVMPVWSHHMMFVRHWHVVALTAVLPLLRFVAKWRERRRRRSGLCAACGYDLRATPDRCPECGMAAEAAAAR